jgi:hypothetical protein
LPPWSDCEEVVWAGNGSGRSRAVMAWMSKRGVF